MEKSYIVNKEIGSGSFGKVILVEAKQTGIQYVVKKVELTKLNQKQKNLALKEVDVLAQLKHPNIVRYKQSFHENEQLSIVMEYCENGDLHRLIVDKSEASESFSDSEILEYFVQICLALQYVHGQKILHRDLKTKNIFLTKGNVIKLGDFGIARVLENSFELAQTCVGSPFYISPEICENQPYNKKSDVWALGCVLYELTTLKYAFITKNVKALLTKIVSGSFNPLPTNINIRIRFLITSMLKPNPKDRPTVSEILNRPLLQEYKQKHTSADRGLSKIKPQNCDLPILNNARKTLPISKSCFNLNITNPEVKYKTTLRAKKKSAMTGNKTNDAFRNTSEVKIETKNVNLVKAKRFPEVDSQYYNLIVGSKKDLNVNKVWEPKERLSDVLSVGNEDTAEAGDRKKWLADTAKRNELIQILGEADLMSFADEDVELKEKAGETKSEKKPTIDELFSLDLTNFDAEVLIPTPVREEDSHVNVRRCTTEKFTAWPLDVSTIASGHCLLDLGRIIEDLDQHLDGSGFAETCENDFAVVERKRRDLEAKLGLEVFLKAHRKMADMLSEEAVDGSKTYTIHRATEPDNGKGFSILDARSKELCSRWQEAMQLVPRTEDLMEIWELVKSEHICYQSQPPEK